MSPSVDRPDRCPCAELRALDQGRSGDWDPRDSRRFQARFIFHHFDLGQTGRAFLRSLGLEWSDLGRTSTKRPRTPCGRCE